MKQKTQMGIEKWAEVASITQSLGLAYQSPSETTKSSDQGSPPPLSSYFLLRTLPDATRRNEQS